MIAANRTTGIPIAPDLSAGIVTFDVDVDARSGDAVPALAQLLIGMWRKRGAAERPAADANNNNTEV